MDIYQMHRDILQTKSKDDIKRVLSQLKEDELSDIVMMLLFQINSMAIEHQLVSGANITAKVIDEQES